MKWIIAQIKNVYVSVEELEEGMEESFTLPKPCHTVVSIILFSFVCHLAESHRCFEVCARFIEI